MSRKTFSGVYVPLATPFSASGEINEAAFQRLIDLMVAQGASGLVPCGTTGESATLTLAEHHRIIALTVQFAAGRVPVIAGTGSNCTAEAIELTQSADKAGVDGMLVIVPYYNRPGQDGIIAHFRAVAACTEKPIIMYNIPKRTGVNMDSSTTITLSKVANITGIKEASGDLAQMMEIIQGTEDFSILTGDDSLLFPLVALGGHGGICTSSHFQPGEWVRLVTLTQAGKIDEARELHYRLLPLANALFCEPNPAPLKAGLNLLGLEMGDPRLPILPATKACIDKMREALAALDIC